MNKFLILCALAIVWSCGTHTHSDPHAGHNHGAETACSGDHAATTQADPHAGHDHGAEAPAETEGEHSSEIVLTPEQIKMLGVSAETLTRGSLRTALRTSGVVAPASGDRAVAAATTEGIVLFANPSLTIGSTVTKGQRLFVLSSRTLAEGDRTARALAAYNKSEAAYQRAKDLAADQIVSQKELETAQLEFRQAELAYKALQSSATEGGVAITAPISGIITALDATNGSYAALGTPLATVSQNLRLTLTADVPLSHVGELGSYTDARFRHQGEGTFFSTNELQGRRTGANASVGAGSAYGSVSFEVNNRAGIVPGAFAEVVLLGAERPNVLSVPTSALLEQEGFYSAVVQLDQECFEVRPVVLGASDGQRTEILSGVAAGDKVVTQGAYRVKMAGATSAIPHGHAH